MTLGVGNGALKVLEAQLLFPGSIYLRRCKLSKRPRVEAVRNIDARQGAAELLVQLLRFNRGLVAARCAVDACAVVVNVVAAVAIDFVLSRELQSAGAASNETPIGEGVGLAAPY